MKIGNIKFKAKRLDNGEWVKGDLAHSLDGGLNIFGFTRENGVDCYSGVHLIDPSTVCQFTGMKDCKGNEIWEGDIVNDNYDLLCIDNLYEVVYIEEEGTFAFKSLDEVDNYEPFVNLLEVYVVGNKFDKEK